MTGTYSISKLAELFNAEIYGNAEAVQGLSIPIFDSRKIQNAENSVFFAIKSARDGHQYINDAYQKGVRVFVVENLPVDLQEDACYLLVNNSMQALQIWAAHYRGQLQFPVIAIAGSRGKTIVKEWLYQILNSDYEVVRSPLSFNSQIGVPVSILSFPLSADLGIVEVGISEPGEMERLANMLKPDFALFTNFLKALHSGFSTENQRLNELLKLFSNTQKNIFCADYQVLSKAFDKNLKSEYFSWSQRKAVSTLQFVVKKNGEKNLIKFESQDGQTIQVEIPFKDSASVENLLHTFATVEALGLKVNYSQAVERIQPVEMRLELREAQWGSIYINDTYSTDLDSLRNALEYLKSFNQYQEQLVILSAFECGNLNENELYCKIAEMLFDFEIKNFIAIGDAYLPYKSILPVNTEVYANSEDFLKNFSPKIFKSKAILIKGARKYKLEKIAHLLDLKIHSTYLEINLSAIEHNLNYYRKKLPVYTGLMVMVKALSYGTGTFEVAGILQKHGVEYLAVAYTDEGIKLRQSGITLPIMVMSPRENDFSTLLNHQLEPEIFNFSTLHNLINTVKLKPVKIHIKVNTGMNRLGFSIEDAIRVAQTLNKYPNIQVATIFTHLAGAENSELDDFTQSQLDKFDTFYQTFVDNFQSSTPIFRHAYNTAGIERYGIKRKYEFARLGIGLYGISHKADEQKQLKNVISLYSTIVQIHQLGIGESVGYGRAFVASQKTTIAVVPIGYADGFRRDLGNGVGKVYINGAYCPVVGNVCMDMIMVNITDVEAQEGDQVEIIGNHISPNLLAQWMKTIPYEVLTGISERVRRVYVKD